LKQAEELSDWYAFYTFPRAEKKVAELLGKHNHEYYLPLIKTLKQWSDRKKIVIEPVFKSYIFVNIKEHFIKNILPLEGILKVVHFGGIAQKIPSTELNYLRLLLEYPDEIEIQNHLQEGDRVRVIQGPLAGAFGFLSHQNKKNFSINIDIIGQSIAVQIKSAYLEKLTN
jgi:transcription antitermination factor NusG